MLLEVCANSYASALAAQQGGAKRVELCDNLAVGGTTPSYAQIKLCVENLSIETWPIIRPRGGDFLYDDIEFELIKEDMKLCKSLGCHGVVTGILKANGDIDKERIHILKTIAGTMPIAFHRAFDMSNNLPKSLEDLIELRIVRVLSSGAKPTAIAGANKLAQLVKQADKRIEIMPGAGINTNNIKKLIETTAAPCYHASAKDIVRSKMMFKNQQAKMGNIEDEYAYELTSSVKVEQLVAKINKYSKNT